MMTDRSREQWAQALLINDSIDFSLLSDSLSKTLSREFKLITRERILELFLSSMGKMDIRWMIIEDGKILFGVPLMFKRYTVWITSIGEELGIDCGQNEVADDWISESMPRTRSLVWGLADMTSDYMSSRADRIESEKGYSPSVALINSLHTGESFDQSRTRILHKTVGLKAIKK
jgi:hypothetical protein